MEAKWLNLHLVRVTTTLRFAILLGTAISLVVGGVACRKEDKNTAPRQEARGDIHATQAYLETFGRPPTTAEGTCYALVGYYPDAEKPDRIRPFPLFVFDRDHQMQILVEQLLHWGEGWDLGGATVDPFPPGVELLALNKKEGDMVRMELTGNVLEQTGPEARKAILNMFAQALTQFDGVDRVMLVGGGVLFPGQAERGFRPDPSAVIGPGPPRLLTLTGTWEKDEGDPVEVSVLFDRPVDVQNIRLLDEHGRELAGDYFRAMFDMAVVVHPSHPESVLEGAPFTISWRVTDALKRSAAGEDVFPLKKIVHQRN